MEYKLCKDYDNMVRCDGDCRRCSNLVHEALTNENKNLKMRLDKLTAKLDTLAEEKDGLLDDIKRITGERNRIHDELKELKMENDKLRTMNSELIYRNGLLMKTTGPAIFQYSYGELSDKIDGLKEDIIRLDKCLSKRQCVQLERIKEEDNV